MKNETNKNQFWDDLLELGAITPEEVEEFKNCGDNKIKLQLTLCLNQISNLIDKGFTEYENQIINRIKIVKYLVSILPNQQYNFITGIDSYKKDASGMGSLAIIRKRKDNNPEDEK